MLQLPFSCYCSPLKVVPANWESKRASVKKNWYIYYRFYDPLYKNEDQYSKGKLVLIKGMNGFKALGERQKKTAVLLYDELERLKTGFNPIRNTSPATLKVVQEILPTTSFVQALWQVKTKVRGVSTTLSDIKVVIGFVEKAALRLGYSDIPISLVSRKHLKSILLAVEQEHGPSSHRYNKIRSYLMILFKELIELEVIEVNPVNDISKQKGHQKIRKVLSMEDRKRVDEHLKQNYYRFWLFTHVFFHSGARLTELVELKGCMVNLQEQQFLITIRKGRHSKEVVKPIKDVALPYWQEAMQGAGGEDYVFSKGLLPGKERIQSYQITKRWSRLIKKKLGIEEDFYSLKHLNLDETAAELSLQDAAAMASHSSTGVTSRHYTINEVHRQQERLKRVGNKFA